MFQVMEPGLYASLSYEVENERSQDIAIVVILFFSNY